MPGLNLSQTLGTEKPKGSRGFFDRSFVFVVGLTILVVVVWGGGIRLLLYRVDQQMTDLQAQVTASQSVLQGEGVDRVASIDTRARAMADYEGQSVVMNDAFTRLERLTLPSVRLTEYTFDYSKKEAKISGITGQL
ncbi:MAG: hypothetical protein WDN67_00885 [Candidatus Moraniibacteriota bacterium]